MTQMRKWSIVTVVAVLVVFAAGWFMLVKPQKSKATSLRTQATNQVQANSVLQTQILSLQQEERQLTQEQAVSRKFSTQVPDTASEPTIIRQLSAAAAGAGVDLISMTPGTASQVVSATPDPSTGQTTDPATAATAAPTTGTDTTTTTPAAGATTLDAAPATTATLEQLPIAIGITGTFPNIESFFQSLEKLPRALMVTGWSLCPEAVPGSSNSGAAATSGAAACSPPTVPVGKSLPPDALGGTLSANIFYTPPVVATPTTATGTTTPATGTTTPAPTTSTAATTPTTGATTAPAN